MDWRAGAARQLMSDGALLQLVFVLVSPLLLPDPWYRLWVMGSIGMYAAALLAARYARLTVAGQGWCLVVNLVALALGGFALFGPGSGSVLLGGTALLVARVFLGPAIMGGVAVVLVAGLAVIATSFVMGSVPWEVPSPTVSLFAPASWLRTTVSGALVVIALVRLISVLVRQVEWADARNAELLGQAERAIRLRDRFLELASHELRTPLTALQWAAEGVEGRRIALTKPRIERLAGLISRNVDRLRVLVVQLVDATAIEAGTLSLNRTRTDLVDVVRRVVQRFDAQPLRTAVIDMFLPDELWGTWDAARLELVVTNLVGNALRFGEGGPVLVYLSSRADRVLLSVRDHGRGISAEQIPHLFERFHESKADAPSSGLGLGLYMARAIVEAHGGAVRVESQLGRGSTFYVDLPWVRSSASDPDSAGGGG